MACKLEVGLVDDNIKAHFQEGYHLIPRDTVAGGVVGGGEEDELGTFVGGSFYGVEVNPVIRCALELNELAAGNVGEELVHAECGDTAEHSITRFQEGDG